MANKKISQLDAITSLEDADIVPAVHSGATNKITWANVKAAIKAYTDTLYNNYVHPNHSGEVTSVADGATTIANKAVVNARLADMANATIKGRKTTGTGVPEDLSVLDVQTLLSISSRAFMGVATTGDTTLSAGETRLFANAYYENLIIPEGATLITSGLKLFVSGTLTINGTLRPMPVAKLTGNNGSSGATGAAGAALVTGINAFSATTYVSSSGSLNGNGAAGGAGNTGAGSAGTVAVISQPTCRIGGNGGASGAGGNGSSANGGAAKTVDTDANEGVQVITNAIPDPYNWANTGVQNNYLPSQRGGCGGSGGGGNSVVKGGGGGSGGVAGCHLGIYARNVVIGATGQILATGGNGGNGGDGAAGADPATTGTGGGGAGGGGAGGFISILCETYTRHASGVISVAGGTGGTGGALWGLGTAGGNGGNGTVGNIIVYSILQNRSLTP